MTLWMLAPLLIAGATAYDQTFERATTAYEQGDYDVAIRMYEQLVGEGVVDAAVFYNLGNAYSRAGKLGPAIANYERALREAPGFEAAQANLAQCLGKSKRRLARPIAASWQVRFLPWGRALPPALVNGLAIFFWFLVWIFLGVRLLVPRRYLRRAAVFSAVLAGAFGLTAYAQSHPPQLAVVTLETVPARIGAEHGSSVRHQLYEGDRVLVERRRDGWAEVVTAGGERGWVPENSLTFVGPPYDEAHRSGAPAEPVESPL